MTFVPRLVPFSISFIYQECFNMYEFTFLGRKFYSSSPAVAIKGSKLFFQDGSIVDGVTGAINAKDKSAFSFDPPFPPWKQALQTTGEIRVDNMRKLFLGSIPFLEVFIQPHVFQWGTVQVSSSDPAILDSVRKYQYNGELTIDIEKYPFGKRRVTGMILDDDLRDALASPSKGTLIVRVPYGTTLDLAGCWNDLKIDDFGGNLQLDTASFHDLNIGQTADLRLVNNGQSLITFSAVTGDVSVTVNQSGGVTINDSASQSHGDLSININADGSVLIFGRSRSAKVNMLGNGDVTIGPVSIEPVVGGSGKGFFTQQTYS